MFSEKQYRVVKRVRGDDTTTYTPQAALEIRGQTVWCDFCGSYPCDLDSRAYNTSTVMVFSTLSEAKDFIHAYKTSLMRQKIVSITYIEVD